MLKLLESSPNFGEFRHRLSFTLPPIKTVSSHRPSIVIQNIENSVDSLAEPSLNNSVEEGLSDAALKSEVNHALIEREKKIRRLINVFNVDAVKVSTD